MLFSRGALRTVGGVVVVMGTVGTLLLLLVMMVMARVMGEVGLGQRER